MAKMHKMKDINNIMHSKVLEEVWFSILSRPRPVYIIDEKSMQ